MSIRLEPAALLRAANRTGRVPLWKNPEGQMATKMLFGNDPESFRMQLTQHPTWQMAAQLPVLIQF